ncbi:MAG: isoprenyl transferase [Thermodesulfobacteriota bacterium]
MKEIDPARLPEHIAIIMDGNGRWAAQHAMGRILGHKKGADSVQMAVRTCRRIGIRYLTLYAFSMENWLRPKEEVTALLNLLREYLENEVQQLMEQDIRLVAIGDLASLGEPIHRKLMEVTEKTSGNRGMILSMALSYGGRDEIVAAVRRMVSDGLAGKMTPDQVTKERCAQYLYTAGIPDPDLLIRTGGEYRISNFLLWQMAYTEFYFTDTLWPDFQEPDLLRAVQDYQRRERRFGKTSEQLKP